MLYKCGVLFICSKVFQNLPSDKRTAPHFLFYNRIRGAGYTQTFFVMKKLFVVLAVCAFGVGIGSASAQKKDNLWFNETTTRNLEPRQDVYATPMLADLKMMYRDRQVFDSVYVAYSDISEIIKRAMFDFSQRCVDEQTGVRGADVIVGSLYQVNTYPDDRGNTVVDKQTGYYMVRVKIVGYPAYYTNFRPARYEDKWIIDTYPRVDNSVRNAAIVDRARTDKTAVVIPQQ